jgi:hypothetical protein
VTRRQRLEAALTRAEEDLQTAVTVHAAAGTDRFTASDTLDKARATCRSAHAALTELNNSER